MAHRVLIVDNDAATRRVLVKLLLAIGWEVAEAGSIAEGLALLDTAPNFLVIDLELPDGDGEEILRAIRTRGATPCVIVCSGVVDRERLRLVRQLGPHAVLSKPISHTALLAAFRS